MAFLKPTNTYSRSCVDEAIIVDIFRSAVCSNFFVARQRKLTEDQAEGFSDWGRSIHGYEPVVYSGPIYIEYRFLKDSGKRLLNILLPSQNRLQKLTLIF
jgi:hypothetical protein